MSGRISIKGKGAELFFGDGHPTDESASQTSRTAAPEARQTDSLPASKTDSEQERKTDSKTARQTDDKPAVWPTEAIRYLRDALGRDHPVHNTFRYSQADLDELRDVVYELEVKRRIKTSRNDILRLALAWVLDDYRVRGADSLIVAILKEERWEPGS